MSDCIAPHVYKSYHQYSDQNPIIRHPTFQAFPELCRKDTVQVFPELCRKDTGP